MAILGNAKRFIRSPSAQKVIGAFCILVKNMHIDFGRSASEGIWSGRIVYHAVNQYAIIADVSTSHTDQPKS